MTAFAPHQAPHQGWHTVRYTFNDRPWCWLSNFSPLRWCKQWPMNAAWSFTAICHFCVRNCEGLPCRGPSTDSHLYLQGSISNSQIVLFSNALSLISPSNWNTSWKTEWENTGSTWSWFSVRRWRKQPPIMSAPRSRRLLFWGLISCKLARAGHFSDRKPICRMHISRSQPKIQCARTTA